MENKDQPAYSTAKVRFISQEGTTYYDDTKLGLTKRELIAAMAMQGMLANSELLENGSNGVTDVQKMIQGYAEDAVIIADELLTQLNKTL